MKLKDMAKNHESWIDTRSEREIFEDHMFQEYKLEKKRWGESNVLSRSEYLKQNKLFLDAGFEEWQNGEI